MTCCSILFAHINSSNKEANKEINISINNVFGSSTSTAYIRWVIFSKSLFSCLTFFNSLFDCYDPTLLVEVNGAYEKLCSTIVGLDVSV